MASVLDLIGATPLVEVTRIDCGPCRLFLKLESANPSGSIKDRPARTMIEAAEADGSLRPGGTIVEATAGNTGLGLALVGGRKGYRTLLVVPDKMAREKVLHAKAMGAQVVITRSDVGKGHPDYYQDLAEAITRRTPNAFYVNQFANAANPRAHELTTGPEILRQMEGDVDAVVVGVGSGGTLTGIGRFLRQASPATEMILADPAGSILAPLVETGKMTAAGSWAVEGIGEDFVPPNADLSLVRKAYVVADAESFATARELLLQEGVLAGSSSGTLLAAALRHCRAQSEPRRVVTLVCDSGAKYLSKVFNPAFIAQEGWTHPRRFGTVRDVVVGSTSEGTAIVVRPQDNLRAVFSRMRRINTDICADKNALLLDGSRLNSTIAEKDAEIIRLRSTLEDKLNDFDKLSIMMREMSAEITRLGMKQERMLCKACGAITRNDQCDCTRQETGTQMLINYADMTRQEFDWLNQEDERLRNKNDRLRAALHWTAQNCLDNACVQRAMAALEQRVAIK
jgi:cystathionine beta-synthase